MELYKGQLSFDDISYKLTYKEAIKLREVRIERLKREREEMEKERKEAESKQRRDSIMKK